MQADHGRFTGVMPALITPYTESGEINGETGRHLVRHLMEQGVGGFYVGGSTGEGPLQRPDERAEFASLVIEEVGGRLPVVIHVGAPDTDTCVDLARRVTGAGADAVSAVAPYYYRHDPEQVREHYLEIANASDAPLIIYHYPELSEATSSVDFFAELATHEEIIGAKYTSRDVYQLQQVVEACGDDFLLYNGADEVCAAGLMFGASGAIGSTYNMMPQLALGIYEAVREGRLEDAAASQREANVLITRMLEFNPISFIKEVLKLQGFDVGEPRRPIQRLTETQKGRVRELAEGAPFLLPAGNR